MRLNYGGEIEASLHLRGPAGTVAPLRVTREVPMRARVRSCRGGGTSGKGYLLLIARPSLASCWCERRGRCLEARRGTAARDSHPRSIVHRGILGSSTHLEPRGMSFPRERQKSKNLLRCHFFLIPAICTSTEYVCLIICSPRLRGRIADAPTGSS
jgi:hypothetical protein